jgi:hypothetical protein
LARIRETCHERVDDPLDHGQGNRVDMRDFVSAGRFDFGRPHQLEQTDAAATDALFRFAPVAKALGTGELKTATPGMSIPVSGGVLRISS